MVIASVRVPSRATGSSTATASPVSRPPPGAVSCPSYAMAPSLPGRVTTGTDDRTTAVTLAGVDIDAFVMEHSTEWDRLAELSGSGGFLARRPTS